MLTSTSAGSKLKLKARLNGIINVFLLENKRLYAEVHTASSADKV